MDLTEPAPAKLNLALHVRRRRGDGYHDLDSIFAFTDFGDTLNVAASAALSLTIEGEFSGAAGAGDDNLVLRAARALAAAAGIAPRAALHLVKRIPVAAGMGGGSADAAAALRLLNRFWGLDWAEAHLLAIAATLGADVPACVASRTCLGLGKGDDLLPWAEAVSGIPVLLVNPRVAVPTGPVFKAWDGVDRGGIDAGAPLAALRNDLAAPAIAIAPVIADVLAALEATRTPTLVRMSGSGATCFATYASAADRDAAAEGIRQRSPLWWVSATTLL